MSLSLLCFELRISIEVQIGVLNLQAFTNSCFHLLFWNQWPSKCWVTSLHQFVCLCSIHVWCS